MDAAALKAKRERRDLFLQLLLVASVAIVLWAAVTTAQTKLTELNMASGFGFLERATGWAYSFSMIDRSIDDS